MDADIAQALQIALQPEHLEVHNDSHQHRISSNNSHFRVLIVSDLFTGLSPIARHRRVYQILTKALTTVHALSIQSYTSHEWRNRQQKAARTPPNCVHQ